MKKKIIFKSIAVLCILACILSVYQVLKINYEYKQGEEEYSDLVDTFVLPASEGNYEPVNITVEDTSEHVPIDIDFEALMQQNPNAVGWIYSPGTVINYPVVQGSDNSYYLNHLFDKRINSSGAIFMDASNSPDMSDVNTVIYGHNMKNGTMFTAITKYKSQQYYEDHPVIYYLTKDRNYKIDVFSSYETADKSDAYTIFFNSEEAYSDFLQQRRDMSQINTLWLPVSAEDNIMTLMTCSYGSKNARYVVHGKLTPLD